MKFSALGIICPTSQVKIMFLLQFFLYLFCARFIVSRFFSGFVVVKMMVGRQTDNSSKFNPTQKLVKIKNFFNKIKLLYAVSNKKNTAFCLYKLCCFFLKNFLQKKSGWAVYAQTGAVKRMGGRIFWKLFYENFRKNSCENALWC